MSDRTSISPVSPANLPLTHPLDDFYARANVHLPPLAQIDGEAMPEPYRTLLVHRNDMTPTLEKFYGTDIHLRVLGKRRSENEYFREVVLLLDGSNRPVEFGASKINLNFFAPDVREQILAEQRPLGHILNEYKVPHRCHPRAFLRLASDPLMNEALELSGAQILFGRRNSLLDLQDRVLAEVVEILPPARKGEDGE